MEALEEALQKLLQDPAQLAGLSSLAHSLGLGAAAPQEPAGSNAPPPPPPPSPPAGPPDTRQERLLLALKPFLKPSRQEKIDRALRAARLSRLAGSALRGSGS